MATTGCSVRKTAAPGAGAGLRTTAASGFPPAACGAQELPEVGELECTCASSPTLGPAFGESQGLQGTPMQREQDAKPPTLSPLTRSESPLNPGSNWMSPACPAPYPSEATQAPAADPH